MSQKIITTIVLDPKDLEITLENAKKTSQRLIHNFDAFRYLGMFDAIYLDRFTDAKVPHQTVDKLNVVSPLSPASLDSAISSSPDGVRFNMIISAVNWFLQKSATATKDRLIIKLINPNVYAIQSRLNLSGVLDGQAQVDDLQSDDLQAALNPYRFCYYNHWSII